MSAGSYMPHYNFIAKDPMGRNYRGTLYGPTEQSVFFRLQKLGYVVISVTEKDERKGDSLFSSAISPGDVVIFARLLGTVISTGLPAVDALAAIEEQTENISFKRIIRGVREHVEQGGTITSAFEKHPKIFPHLLTSMVGSGELSGKLAEVLERAAGYLEREQELRRSISTAFIYPKIVLTIAVSAIVPLMWYVVPSLANLVKSAHFRLPTSTRILLGADNFFVANKPVVMILVALLVMGLIFFKYHPAVRGYYQALVMKLPILGPINRRITISRTVRTLGSLLSCGVPLVTAIESVKSVVYSKPIEDDLDRVIESVEAGGTISSPLRLSRNFPSIAVYLIASGEQSGRLSELLEVCSNAIDKEIEHFIKKFIIFLEPAVTVFVALIVVFFAFAFYLPIMQIIYSQMPK
jgi:type II secretory pathway component PulF